MERPAFLKEAVHAITDEAKSRSDSKPEISAALLAAENFDRTLSQIEKSAYRDPFDQKVISEVMRALGNEADLIRLKNLIASETPRLGAYLNHIEREQEAASFLRSSMRPLPEDIRNTKVGRGVTSFAAAIELSRRAGYPTFYPDPVLDALYKTDFIAASRDEQVVFLVQVKTIPQLHGAHAQTAHAFLKSTNAMPLTPEWKKIKEDLIVLQRFSGILSQKYAETFVPLLFSVPASQSPKYALAFDKTTGLPRREISGIILPQR